MLTTINCKLLIVSSMFSLFLVPPQAETSAQTLSPYRAHDLNRPKPKVVQPGGSAAEPPSDAIVLFDGSNLDAWTSSGAPPKWGIEQGDLVAKPNSGPLKTRESFGDVQLHVEWCSPNPPKGRSQGRGNSGVYLMTKYEVQVLDSYENETYADGQAAAVYGQNPPLVNASRPPGEWQTYDIIFRRPRFGDDGELTSPAIVTVFHNGVLVQDHFEFWGPTNWLKFDPYTPHEDALPIQLQDHGNPVRFRNIWVRRLADVPVYSGLHEAVPQIELTTYQLDRLEGQFGPLKVQIREGQPALNFFGRWFELVPESETSFQLKRTHATLDVHEDESGQIIAIELSLMGARQKHSRVTN